MPEGRTVHRLARQHLSVFGGQRLTVSSPQGRFASGAARLDGRVLCGAQAHGKHMFLGFAGVGFAGAPQDRPDTWLHVHLGLYGKWTFGELDGHGHEGTTGSGGRSEPPEPYGALRVRLVGDRAWADLRGPTACEVLTTDDVAVVRTRLGADPLRRDADPAAAGARILRSKAPIGALLMQQEVVSGIGNVYRAEALFRGRIDPWSPGTALGQPRWDELWADLVVLLKDGVRRGRIVTTLPQDRSRRAGVVSGDDAHYVYGRTGLPCRVCGTQIVTEPMVGRNLYRCPVCQAT